VADLQDTAVKLSPKLPVAAVCSFQAEPLNRSTSGFMAPPVVKL
jgi:hypothetical protein